MKGLAIKEKLVYDKYIGSGVWNYK
jgi:hypothetical protein